MSLTVKICGLSSEETLDAALASGADIVGFVFFRRSPRFVTPARAAELAARARGRAEIAALIVDMPQAEIAEVVAAVRPDWLQMHGAESVEAVSAARRAFGVRAMKALPVGVRGDLDAAARYEAVADMLLLDAKPPKDATRPGGNGRTFDWTILRNASFALPYMLSGGLTPANVAEAIRITGATGVDVSSGVESAPGQKDIGLIRAFIANARAAARQPEKAAS
jgi:phosphoribosylanthranilate isomerase